MIKRRKLKLNSKGFTIIEVFLSIIISSFVLSFLMTILSLVVTNRARMEVKNELYYESYVLTETIQNNLYDKQAQEIELIQNDDDAVVIEFRHIREIVVLGAVLQDPDFVDPNPHRLVFDKVNGQITYDKGEGDGAILLHSDGLVFLENTNLEVISIDGTCDFVSTYCEEAVIKLTVVISLSFQDGDIESKEYVTTIII